jgi:hypothetical protein
MTSDQRKRGVPIDFLAIEPVIADSRQDDRQQPNCRTGSIRVEAAGQYNTASKRVGKGRANARTTPASATRPERELHEPEPAAQQVERRTTRQQPTE